MDLAGGGVQGPSACLDVQSPVFKVLLPSITGARVKEKIHKTWVPPSSANEIRSLHCAFYEVTFFA